MAESKSLPEGLKEFSLNGKAALVIGAEHPVGRVAAITLAEAGAKVLIASQ
ncbi:MAG: 2-deoxy-D-gluconate 3-dehydrogenase, partial [Deltaproteobacteria bacterium]|nr:2-deoxy-D-gluconate 3-dehydrogenase [Deltaproteobacteria bacterium]